MAAGCDADRVYDPKRAPLWSAFLRHLARDDEDLERFYQRWIGYCLTGLTGEKVFMFAWGPPDTGKSVFVNVILAALGTYTHIVHPDSLTDRGRGQVPDDIAQAAKKRLVVTTEPRRGSKWNDELIKAITGGDTIRVRRLYGSWTDMKPHFKLMVVGNDPPELGRMDEAMKRRLLIAPMDNPVPREEQIMDLTQRIIDEELPQVLAWAMVGNQEWQREGLNPPEAIMAVTESYWQEEDTLGQWIDAECQAEEGYWTPAAELYGSWTGWCRVNGYDAETLRSWKQMMDQAGYSRSRQRVGDERPRGYDGLRLNMEDI